MQMRFVHKFFATVKQTVGALSTQRLVAIRIDATLRIKVSINVINGSLDLPIALIRIRSCVHRRTQILVRTLFARATFIRARLCVSGTVRLIIINNPVSPAGPRFHDARDIIVIHQGVISTSFPDKTEKFLLLDVGHALFIRRRFLEGIDFGRESRDEAGGRSTVWK